MATAIRVPANCSSITFTTSGVLAPTARIISGITPAEATALVHPTKRTVYIISTAAVGGAASIQFPPGLITSITINGNVCAVSGGGVITAVPAVDATAFIGATWAEPFQLVTGA